MGEQGCKNAQGKLQIDFIMHEANFSHRLSL
jgi:hypothetical protein